MSFIITVYVREGIVMASDSRLTLNTQSQSGDKITNNVAVGMSDSNYKTFLAPNNIGISTFGAADIGGVPLAGFIESFINEQLGNGVTPVEDVAEKLLNFFGTFKPAPAASFHVAGYTVKEGRAEQEVWVLEIVKRVKKKVNPANQQGASWGGESDIITRLIQSVQVLDETGKVAGQMPMFPVPWQFFTLQDAIDFSIFAVRSTIDAIKFQPRAKTVGGPVDVLVIKPEKAFWVQRKELHA